MRACILGASLLDTEALLTYVRGQFSNYIPEFKCRMTGGAPAGSDCRYPRERLKCGKKLLRVRE